MNKPQFWLTNTLILHFCFHVKNKPPLFWTSNSYVPVNWKTRTRSKIDLISWISPNFDWKIRQFYIFVSMLKISPHYFELLNLMSQLIERLERVVKLIYISWISPNFDWQIRWFYIFVSMLKISPHYFELLILMCPVNWKTRTRSKIDLISWISSQFWSKNTPILHFCFHVKYKPPSFLNTFLCLS